jgi:hypothetical protein
MKKVFTFLFWVALLTLFCLTVLALIGIAAQAPGTSELINSYQSAH